MEDDMATFILRIDWTDQGIRNVKEAPKRSRAAKELAKTLGVEIKEVYLTSGEHDILLLAEAPLGDNITKLALALSSLGNIRTCTSRAWPEAEWTKLISELP
ncbi:GYD domain-containing protein [Bradyrhizobium sp. UFLA06-06]|uniref:GYD domain-containing protein n=3 Tax=Bradyrhizobium TaxID=374 RepID=A0A1E3EFJ1_BRAEL|nr:GYD domain-containing protein [Bradyrhizobium sp. BRP56]MCA6102982.1 GYD domain-containing protein [Bradyrhizobium australafricanum]MCC8946283.1 GYD domain-containing protein [Bradyrhizobium brasilense]MTV12031.1 GYD domain-containing protein [Bradyrhizobium sp. BR2003]NWL43585.1 GYD domain-containing protein [Bradyrhizobium elkanii]QOZ18516.1 GYD domain-containing protein [Bradyrhizobium sp. CCBAU 21365]UQD84615.1 GYD domain-containing protein [Bradyrhizobium elkanii USDA 76]